MCGIAVLLGASASSDLLTRMLQVASRRGPEATQLHATPDALFGHAALRFVEVADNPQPLVLDDGSLIVWNGEIYNWRELGLSTRSDTETLLSGLRQRGEAFLRDVDGQFAFVARVIAADGGARLLVGRDKWGICPLVFGHTPEGWLAIGSTPEVVRAAGVRDVKAVPAGTVGVVEAGQLRLRAWYRLPRTPPSEQRASEPGEVLQLVEQSVHARIPDAPRELFTTMGGIDSQFVTACVARRLHGQLGGAVTVVPWRAATGGDYPLVQATLAMLASEGIELPHHVVELTPEHAESRIDPLLTLLGPDLFHLLCALAEDLVASTVRALGGRVIMTAGGPDEAGRSYDRWTVLHRGQDEELAWRRLAEQFGSSEGVRAGLVFGEHGIENRVPLAELMQLASQLRADDKQAVLHEGDGLTLTSLQLDTKIFWRRALRGVLPDVCLNARKEPIHGSTGAMSVLFALCTRDPTFQQRRLAFAWQASQLGWNGIVFGDLRQLDPSQMLTECQLYALYRWSLLEPELFRLGGEHRYGRYIDYLPRFDDDPVQRQHKPLCHDWLLGTDVQWKTVS
jgi:asparagine synthetase B (glutamine-hydrolysing)